jgi:hypothetical protein
MICVCNGKKPGTVARFVPHRGLWQQGNVKQTLESKHSLALLAGKQDQKAA